MDFELSDDQKAIKEGVAAVVSQFDDEYWSGLDESGEYPFAFRDAMAAGGWLGITMPPEYGGAGLGVTEAAIMMREISTHGGGQAAASCIHINLFGPHPIVVFGTKQQKDNWIPALVSGEDRVCFGVTEPDAGLDTTKIKTFARKVDGGYIINGRKMWTSNGQVANKILILARTTAIEDCAKPSDGMSLFYTDLDRAQIEVRRIAKMGRKAVDSNATFIDDYFVPDDHLIGEEGKGFAYIMHSLNPERVLVAAEAIGIGYDALQRASRYAQERVVFGRPIGQNQGIQHPLAECWMNLEAAYTMTLKAAWLYDSGQSCGAEANAAKFLAARAGHRAAEQAVFTLGGLGYAKEYQVERLLREVLVLRIAPVTEQLIMSFIAERVLGQKKSY